ncbi:hypothetical protein EPR50_G00152150 [Perca flavescens]|uniref:Uncharacterized protein n=1 Tax=Perca flavescens TaxID=8167 RepID=A0A484CKW9_PERFV|nr:hypothetical protein EPR50_G00152150 [Perca flavescens]
MAADWAREQASPPPQCVFPTARKWQRARLLPLRTEKSLFTLINTYAELRIGCETGRRESATLHFFCQLSALLHRYCKYTVL